MVSHEDTEYQTIEPQLEKKKKSKWKSLLFWLLSSKSQ